MTRIVRAGDRRRARGEAVTRAWDAGVIVLYQVGSLENVLAVKQAGADAVIGHDDGRPLYLFSTDSPLRSTTGELERMALFAGESLALVSERTSAAEVIERMVAEALEARRRICADGVGDRFDTSGNQHP
ncbi:hypothetical protein ACFSHT_17810 [Paraburkholderia silviterrae]|uniref:hypothetical protein n=1 Tax=Paraburkholderia silviterrae TaxID=2528715 RepID=UPI001F10F57E|nr:hypothetical protein [Paraburkholderia silviterrae]